MLERFKVPCDDQALVPHESLRRTVSAIFQKMGETPDNAATAADTLVTADLWGVESHGVSNMVRYYVEWYGNGRIKANPQWSIIREKPGTAMIDADRGLAIILGPAAMEIAIEKARDVGVGYVSMVNAGHSGAVGVHSHSLTPFPRRRESSGLYPKRVSYGHPRATNERNHTVDSVDTLSALEYTAPYL